MGPRWHWDSKTIIEIRGEISWELSENWNVVKRIPLKNDVGGEHLFQTNERLARVLLEFAAKVGKCDCKNPKERSKMWISVTRNRKVKKWKEKIKRRRKKTDSIENQRSTRTTQRTRKIQTQRLETRYIAERSTQRKTKRLRTHVNNFCFFNLLVLIINTVFANHSPQH